MDLSYLINVSGIRRKQMTEHSLKIFMQEGQHNHKAGLKRVPKKKHDQGYDDVLDLTNNVTKEKASRMRIHTMYFTINLVNDGWTSCKTRKVEISHCFSSVLSPHPSWPVHKTFTAALLHLPLPHLTGQYSPDFFFRYSRLHACSGSSLPSLQSTIELQKACSGTQVPSLHLKLFPGQSGVCKTCWIPSQINIPDMQ